MFHTWIFDMDGLLAETESLWRIAEQEAADQLKIPLTHDDFESTMGIRMRDVAQIWHDLFDWGTSPTPVEVATGVIERVIELSANIDPLPGVMAALNLAEELGMRVALCSSSDLKMIEAIVGELRITDRFEVLHSAEHDEYGKPHPRPYLHTAEKLGVNPSGCLVFEDTITGCVSAKSAGMKVIAVPAAHDRTDVRFGLADVVLGSMSELNAGVLERLGAGGIYPSGARPRFHLAFEVDDLDAARHFYGEVLGCPEGRSADTWVDFDFFGHQLVAHQVSERLVSAETNPVDGQDVPARHFGALLSVEAWDHLVNRLQAHKTNFIIEPQTRFEGEVGEQRTLFMLDPAGNALEFKAFIDETQVFAK